MLLLPMALVPTSAGLLGPDLPPVLEDGLPTLPGPIGDVIGPIPHPLCNKFLPVDDIGLPVPQTQLVVGDVDALPFRWDYGDAPDSNPLLAPMPTYYTPFGSPAGFFPTQANTANELIVQHPGARHRIVGVGWLGNIAAYGGPGNFPRNVGADLRPTLEKDAVALPDEDGIVNLQGNTPDHDGRDDGVYPAAFPTAGFGALTFRVTAASPVNNWYVNALADWNFNGRWGAPAAGGVAEWIVVNMPVSVPAGQSWTFTSPGFATGFIAGTPWIRVTLSDKPIPAAPYGANGWDGSTPPGITTLGQKGFQCGETEDYCGLLFLIPHQTQEIVRCPRPVTNPECQGQQSYARILNVTSNGQPPVPGVQGTSPYSNSTGLIFKAELINATGLLAQVRHHCVKQLTISLVKVPPIPAGTSPAGTKFTTTLFPPCPFNANHNQAIPGGNLDRGEYDLVVSWNGCFTGSGSATQRIILV
jgi:hypothetical protein